MLPKCFLDVPEQFLKRSKNDSVNYLNHAWNFSKIKVPRMFLKCSSKNLLKSS